MNDRPTPPWPEEDEFELGAISDQEAELAAELGRALASKEPPAEDAPELERLLETAGLVRANQRFELGPERKRELRAELSVLWQKAEPEPRPALAQVIRLARWLPLPAAAGGALLWGLQQAVPPAPVASEKAPVTQLAEPAVLTQPVEPAVLARASKASAPAGAARSDEEAQLFFAAPSAALVRAQTELLVQSSEGRTASADARAALERELSQYRSALLASLSQGEGRE